MIRIGSTRITRNLHYLNIRARGPFHCANINTDAAFILRGDVVRPAIGVLERDDSGNERVVRGETAGIALRRTGHRISEVVAVAIHHQGEERHGGTREEVDNYTIILKPGAGAEIICSDLPYPHTVGKLNIFAAEDGISIYTPEPIGHRVMITYDRLWSDCRWENLHFFGRCRRESILKTVYVFTKDNRMLPLSVGDVYDYEDGRHEDYPGESLGSCLRRNKYRIADVAAVVCKFSGDGWSDIMVSTMGKTAVEIDRGTSKYKVGLLSVEYTNGRFRILYSGGEQWDLGKSSQ